MSKKDELVEKINKLLKESNLNIQSYRKYVNSAGKNLKFLLKVVDKDKHPDLYSLLLQLKKM